MSDEITAKQRKFIQAIADGNTHAESYRIAYSNSGKPATARREAARLMKNPIIRTALDRLIKRKEDVNLARHVSSQELVTRTLRDHITGAIDLEPTQVQSLSILAKTSGMYVLKHEDVTERSSDDIASDLKRKLGELALIADDVIDEESGVTH
jgi:phage terminase small subunit